MDFIDYLCVIVLYQIISHGCKALIYTLYSHLTHNLLTPIE